MQSAIESLRQPELVIVRRLREGPLTEFELAHEIAEHSGYEEDEAAHRMSQWLDDLQPKGLVWAGILFNRRGQSILAAALTYRGRELVG
ncbi:MAG: hypothetical protein IH987_13300 [Planctomycetes bacterium]|nr:hypothetical protein [Planctomycetota bacterium]